MRKLLPAILFVIISVKISAQTQISGIVTDSLNNPIPYASVYLSKTTYGVLTDNKGAYSLAISGNGIYEMIVSSLGYKPYSQFISAEGTMLKTNIRLSISPIRLDEVSVSSKNKTSLADLTLFTKLFLGETPNAEDCKILNSQDLRLFTDSRTKSLNGFSLKPLIIENRALGYSIVYDLTDFTYNPETGFLRFKGDHYFQPLTGSIRESKLWKRNRLSAFYGSRMDLFRSIFSDSLYNENFRLFECRIDSSTNEFTIIKPILESDLKVAKDKNFMAISYKNPILINYIDNHPELATGLTGYQSGKVISTITFSDFINIYPNGYFDNPYSITWGGEMAIERVADMLPYDYQPHQKEALKSEPELSLSPLENYLLAEKKKLPTDQIFVHTDRNSYYPGDTIHFQAYIRDRFTNRFESESVSLYALLFNHKQEIIDSSRFRIYGATSSGWMVIPQKAEEGRYHFTAFTAMMQNNDPSDAFQQDLYVRSVSNKEKIDIEFAKKIYHAADTVQISIRINDINGKPVSNRKFQSRITINNSNIETVEKQTNKNGLSAIRFILPDSITWQPQLKITTTGDLNYPSLTKSFNIPFESDFFEMKFLPEGGTLIEGIEQRIGFNATDYKGEPIVVTGLLMNSKEKVIDTIKSGKYGPGLFSCVPEPGMYVQITDGWSGNKKVPLPQPKRSGVCLCVKPVDNKSLVIEVQSAVYNGDPVTVAGIMNTSQIFSNELQLTKKQRMVVQTENLLSGVVQIVLLNKEMRPLAERLIYVNAEKHLNFKIETEKQTYDPAEETNLTINVTDNKGNAVQGLFSIAVADSSTGHDAEIYTPEIEYSFNYNNNFYRNLPSTVLATGLENLTNEDRDLIFMVYGWRKYRWNFKERDAIAYKFIDYDVLKMKILYASKNNRNDRRLDLISLEGPSIKHFITDKNGEISVGLDSLPHITRSVTMMPDPKNKKRVNGAMLSIPFNEQYFKSNKLQITQLSIDQNKFKISAPENKIKLVDEVIQIPEVTIKANTQPRKIYHDKYEEMYMYGNVKSMDYDQLWSCFTLEDAVRRLVGPYMITLDNVYMRMPRSLFGSPIPAFVVLDGMPIQYDGWNYVKMIPPSTMTSLTILKGGEATTIYGMKAAGGVIFVNTHGTDPSLLKNRTDWKLQHSNDKMLLPISIYRTDREFYTPTKLIIENDPSIQKRKTFFWQSAVYFNGKEPVRLKYNNLKTHGPVRIVINGISSNNLVGSGRASYYVD